MRYYTSLVFGFRLFNMPLLEIKVWICRWRHHGPGHIKPRRTTSDRRSGNLVYCVPRVGLMCSNKQIDPDESRRAVARMRMRWHATARLLSSLLVLCHRFVVSRAFTVCTTAVKLKCRRGVLFTRLVSMHDCVWPLVLRLETSQSQFFSNILNGRRIKNKNIVTLPLYPTSVCENTNCCCT